MNKKLKYLFLAVLIVLAVSVVSATIFYSLTIPSHFGVQGAYGLELYQDGSKITSIEFGLIPRYGNKTLSFSLKNIGNTEANVTLIMPNDSDYIFTTTFPSSVLIPRYNSLNFTITLTDIDMDSAISYSGNFVFSIEG